MQFLCLGYLNMDEFDAAPEAAKSEILSQCASLCIPFRETGKVIFEAGVEHHSQAVSLRPSQQPSKRTFVPGISQLGSVFIIEAEDMEEAIRIASLHPAAQLGAEFGFGIEIRPLQ
ncbi:MAG: hypothetical protein WCK51_12350 [Armatimonadota bacterium]